MVGTVRDAATLAQRSIPNVSVITAGLWQMFEIMAGRSALSWVPAVEAPFPMRGRSADEMHEIAEALVPRIAAIWAGRVHENLRWDGAD